MIAAQMPKQTKIPIYAHQMKRKEKRKNRKEKKEEKEEKKCRNERKVHEIGEDELVKIIKRRPDIHIRAGYGGKPRPRFQNVMTNESRKREEFYTSKFVESQMNHLND